MLSVAKLRARARRRLQLLAEGAGGSLAGNTLAPCYRQGCPPSCASCETRSPLSGKTWGELRAAARGSSSNLQTARSLEIEQLACELREAEERAFIRRRDWSVMQAEQLDAQWEREEREAADRQLVTEVAERRRKAEAAA